jgi:DNA-directed RNA polymerase specialized sigma24 family protein
VLDTFASVERALSRYTDSLQPRTSSVTTLGRHGGGSAGRDWPFPPVFLDELEEREELRRRMAWLDREEAVVLFRWYVEGAKPGAIAAALGRSLRHVYRRRSSGIEALVALGRTDLFEDADVSEFAA